MLTIRTATPCGSRRARNVAPRHVTLNQIFAGMMPFMGIQVIAIVLLYMWPQIGLWLPQLIYSR